MQRQKLNYNVPEMKNPVLCFLLYDPEEKKAVPLLPLPYLPTWVR